MFQGGKGGSPHLSRKVEGGLQGGHLPHLPAAALLHEAKLGEESLVMVTTLDGDYTRISLPDILVDRGYAVSKQSKYLTPSVRSEFLLNSSHSELLTEPSNAGFTSALL